LSNTFDRLRERFQASPADDRRFAALEEQLFLQAQWSDLVAAYWLRLGASIPNERPADRARLLLRLAQVFDERLRAPDQALPCYREALRLDPELRTALRPLRRLLEEREAWDEALPLLEREASAATGPQEAAGLRLDAGWIALRHGLDPARALAHFDSTLAVQPASRDARFGRAEALEALGERETALSVWRELASGASEAERRRIDAALTRLLQPVVELADEPPPPGPVAEPAVAAEPIAQPAVGAEPSAAPEVSAEPIAAEPMATAEPIVAPAAAPVEPEIAAIPAPARAALEAIAVAEAFSAVVADDSLALTPEPAPTKLDDEIEIDDDATGEIEIEIDPSDDTPALREAAPATASADDTPMLRDDGPTLRDAIGTSDTASASDETPTPRAEPLDPEERLAAAARELSLTSDRRRQLELLEQLATGHEEAGRLELALDYGRKLADRTLRVDAYERCERLYARLGQPQGELEILDELDPLVNGAAKLRVRRRRGEILTALARETDALRAYIAALEVDAEDAAAWNALAALHAAAERWPELLEARRRAADLLPETERAAALVELADLQRDRLGDEAGAIATLARAVDLPGAPDGAALRLEAWLEGAERFEELTTRLALRRATLADVDPATRELDLRRAELLRLRLGRAAEAVPILAALQRAFPDDAPVLDAWEHALRQIGDVEELETALALRGARVSGDEAESIAFERAQLLAERLGRPAEARTLLDALVTSAHPERARAVAEARIRLLERERDFPALRSALEARLAAQPAPEAREACALHERLARLCRDRLGDPAGAIRHLEASLALDRAQPGLWRSLALLRAGGADPEAWLAALEGEIASGVDPERALELHATAAELCQGRLRDEARAEGHWRRVLALDPAHPTAAEFLVARYELEERHADLVAVLETRLGLLEDAAPAERAANARRRTSLRLRIADLRARELGDVAGAIETLEPALDEHGPLPAVAEPLAALYAEASLHAPRVDLCRLAADAASAGPERAIWRERLAEALLAADRADEAADAFRAVLDDRRDDVDTLARLAALHRRRGESAALAQTLERALLRATGADEIVQRLELAELLVGALARPGEAMRQLRRVLELEPGHPAALERALELARAEGCEPELLPALDAAVAHARSDARRAALWTRKAEILAGPCSRPSDAAQCLLRAEAAAPGDARRRAALRTALEAAGEWPALLAALGDACADAPAAERDTLLARAADLAEAHLTPADALPWLERLCAARPGDAAALARRSALLRRLDAPEALIASLGDELAVASTAERKHALLLERARLFETRLARPPLAAEALEAARAVAPDDVAVLRELVRLHEHLGDIRSAATRLEELAPRLPASERGAAWRRLAAWRHSILDEPVGAVETLRRALAETADSGEPRAPLLQELGAVLRATGDVDAWARAAEEELALLSPDAHVFAERRHALRVELAEAWAGPLAAPDRALVHLRALADATPDTELDGPARARFDQERHEAETRLLALLRAERASAELAVRLAARVARDADDAIAWRELATVRLEALHDAAGAAAGWREVLARAPGDLSAWRALRICAERRGDFETVAESIDAEIALVPGVADDGADPHARAALLRRLGDVAWRRLGSTTRATRAYAGALEAEPGDRVSLHALQRLLESMEDWKGALELYRSELALLDGSEIARQREVWLHVADVAEQRVADPEGAVAALEAAVALGDASRALRARLADALLGLGRETRFVEVYATVCDDPEEPGSATEELALAGVLARLDRAPEALARAERAAQREPERDDAFDAVAKLRLATGDPVGAADALERAARLRGGAEGARRLVYAAALDASDAERSARRLARATELDPGYALAFARLARVAGGLGRAADAVVAAGRALDLDPSAVALAREERLATALAGGDAARVTGALGAALRLFATALDLAPDHADAAAHLGEAQLALGDAPNARRHLERWQRAAEPGTSPAERARRLALLGAALAATGDDALALARFEEALALDPTEARAHPGRVAALERAGRAADAAEACERWGEIARDPAERARSLVRAAVLGARSGAPAAIREQRLRAALDADACQIDAWAALAELLAEGARHDEVLEAVELGLDLAPADDVAARLLELRGVAHEARGERREAATAYGEAAARDARAVEAALAAARLLRGLGEWRAAADRLQEFAARQPAAEGADRASLARVLMQLARLRAGPLEDVRGAVDAYERALVAQPHAREAHEALAELLTHVPARWDEARRRHRELLEIAPTRVSSIRALGRIARGRGAEDVAANGLAVLRALGAASAEERDLAPERLRLSVAGAASLEHVSFERLRLAFREVAAELGEALGTAATTAGGDAPRARFRELALRAEADLSAPCLVPLGAEGVREVALVLSGLVHERDAVAGDGGLVNRLSSAIGWRARRRLAKRLGALAPEEIADLDFGTWHEELRALAHASALDASGGELRGALVALLEDARRAAAPRLDENADLCALIDSTPAAAALLRRVVLTWADTV